MSKPSRKMKCAVEALEDRQLLTVTTTLLAGGILQITGDSTPEQVNIMQNDATDELSVSWNQLFGYPQGDPMPPQVFQSSTINKIVVKLGGGDDWFTYQLNSQQMMHAKALSVELGAGNDTALFDFGGNLVVALEPYDPRDIDGDGELDYPIDWAMPVPADLSANLVIEVQGGTGRDNIDAIFGNIDKNLTYRAAGGVGDDGLTVHSAGYTGPGSVVLFDIDGGAGQDQLWIDLGQRGISAGARMTAVQRGGAGNDTMNINANLPLYGMLSLHQLGGAGHDTMITHAQMDWQSTGRVVARVSGDTGNDQMTLLVKREAMPPNVFRIAPLPDMRVDAFMSGGSGRNQGWVTGNVRTFLVKVMQRNG